MPKQEGQKDPPNGADSTDNAGAGSGGYWWIKWVLIAVLLVSLFGLGFYAFKLRSQLQAAKSELTTCCSEFEKLKLNQIKIENDIKTLTDQMLEKDKQIEKYRQKSKKSKSNVPIHINTGNGGGRSSLGGGGNNNGTEVIRD